MTALHSEQQYIEFSPGRRMANAMHPYSPECLLITSAADMHKDSDTIGESAPSNAAAVLDLNSSGMSCAG